MSLSGVGILRRAGALALLTTVFVVSAVVSALGYGWSPVSNPATQSITGVSFTSAENGWIVCSNAMVFHTANGGSSWTTVSVGTAVPLAGVRFIDANNGWITGQSNVIRHTTDGGTTWQPLSTAYSAALSRPFALDALHAWIPVLGAGGMTAQTTDGGAVWSYGHAPTSDGFTDVAFGDANHGWVVGTGGAIYRSQDGGSTWETKTPDGFSEWLNGVSVADTQAAYAVGGSGTAISLWDNGVNPTEVTTRATPAASLYAVKAVGIKGEAFAAGWDAIVHTTDWGNSWQLVSSPGPVTLRDLSFPDPFTGFAAGDNGTLLKYTPPVSPVAHSVEATDAYALVVSWDPSLDAASYQLRYKNSTRSNLTTTSVQIASLQEGVSEFAVRAVTTEGLFSEWSTATITNHPVIPAEPAISAPAFVSTASVTLTWPAVEGAVDYLYKLNGGSVLATTATAVTMEPLDFGDNLIEVRARSVNSASAWVPVHVEYAIPETQSLSLKRTPSTITYPYTSVTLSGTTGGHATTVTVEVRPAGGVWASQGTVLRSNAAGTLPTRVITVKSNTYIRLTSTANANWNAASSNAVMVTYRPLVAAPSVPAVRVKRRFTTAVRVYTRRSNPKATLTFTYYRRVGSGSSATWRKITTLTATAGTWSSNSTVYRRGYLATRRGAWRVVATYWGKGVFANRTSYKSFTVK